ncbi:MAG TPA: hypothetical protein VGH28_19860 [Polyangiaceae bacterium]
MPLRALEAIVGTVAALWLIYLVVVNAALASHWARHKVNGKPQVLQAEYSSAYSIVPGVFHMRHVSGWGQFTNFEYQGQIDRLEIDVSLVGLLHHRVALDIHASGVALQGKPPAATKPVDPAIDAPVPLHPVAAPPVPVVDESLASWTVHVKLDVSDGRELWVDGVRYDGRYAAKGAMSTTPNRSFDVKDFVVELDGGKVLVGAKTALPRFFARVDVNLDPVDPRGVDAGAFSRLSVDTMLAGTIGDMRFMQDLAKLPMLFSGDGGSFGLRGKLVHGQLVAPGFARVSNHGMWVGFAGTGVGGAVEADARLEASPDGPIAKLSAEVTRGEVTTAKGTPFVSVPITTSKATASHLDLSNPKTMRFVFDAHAPSTVVPRLTVLNEYFRGMDFKITEGKATGRADIAGDFPKGSLKGAFTFESGTIAMAFGKTKVDGRVAGKLPIVRASSQSDFVLSGMNVHAEGANLDNGDSHTRNWWGFVELPRGTMRFKGEPRYTGTIHASFRDIDPVITAIRKLHGVPDWVNRMLGIGPYNVDAIGTFGKHTKLELIDARAIAQHVITHPHTRVRATYDGTRDPPPWLAEIDFGVLAVGLQQTGHHLGIQLADVGRWFDEKAGVRERGPATTSHR